MNSTCILTDAAAQFSQPGFSGREFVRVLPLEVHMGGKIYSDSDPLRSTELPYSTLGAQAPKLLAPDLEKSIHLLQNLATQFREIIIITTSSELHATYAMMEKAAYAVRGQANITLIDSQTTSVGLGLLVQYTAEIIAKGIAKAELERRIRKAASQVYTLFSLAGLSYLSQAGFIDDAQATVGEMLGLVPIFSLEEGKLSPIDKARNQRAILEFFQEFLCEFDDLQHIAFIQGAPPFNHETHLLREHAQLHFPRTPFSEHTINLPTASILGPRTLGLILFEAD
jgi:DegV family protein with EDD domain